MLDFWRLAAWQYVPSETARSPADGEFNILTRDFFRKFRPELDDKSLDANDEFDTARARAARVKARTSCLGRVAKKAGTPPQHIRVRVKLDAKTLQWFPDTGTFAPRLSADEALRLYVTSNDANSNLEVGDPDAIGQCDGPGKVVVRLVAGGPVRTRHGVVEVEIAVKDPERARTFKERMVSARALAVETLLTLGAFGPTGTMCAAGVPGLGKTAGYAYPAELVAVRLVDGDSSLTTWVASDTAAIPEKAIIASPPKASKPAGGAVAAPSPQQ
jgi:hypothetical protein